MDQLFYDAYAGIMNNAVGPVVEFYNYVMDSKSDPRTNDWFLVKSPVPLLTILVSYVYFCTKAGPRLMKDRKPFDLKYTLIIYNLVQVLFSMFIFHEGLWGGWGNGYKFSCEPVDFGNNSKAIKMAQAVWWYYMAKYSELLDTVFFVLRKKNNQITFLHVYHHFMMPICGWIGVKFLPGGHGSLLGIINSFIHVVMYSYYLIASMGPDYQKYLWWKKHLTEMQLIQFCIVFIHEFQVLFRECNYPRTINILLATQAILFFYLFAKFYVRVYIPKKPSDTTENNNIPNGKLKGY